MEVYEDGKKREKGRRMMVEFLQSSIYRFNAWIFRLQNRRHLFFGRKDS